MDLLLFHTLSAMVTEEPYRQTVSDELLASHPPEFATLMGQRIFNGWAREGPMEHLAKQRARLQRLGVD